MLTQVDIILRKRFMTVCLGRKQRKCYSRERFDSEFRQLIEKETFRKDRRFVRKIANLEAIAATKFQI